MANTFTNSTASCSDTSETTAYTVPSSTVGTVIGCTVANTGAASILVDVKAASKYVVKAAPVPVGSSLSVLDGKIILTAAETLTVTSDATGGDCDVIVSVLEIS